MNWEEHYKAAEEQQQEAWESWGMGREQTAQMMLLDALVHALLASTRMSPSDIRG